MIIDANKSLSNKEVRNYADNFDNIRLSHLKSNDKEDLEDVLDLSEVHEESLFESVLKII